MDSICTIPSNIDFDIGYIIRENNTILLFNSIPKNDFDKLQSVVIIHDTKMIDCFTEKQIHYDQQHKVLCVKQNNQLLFILINGFEIQYVTCEIQYNIEYKSGLWKDSIQWCESKQGNIYALIKKIHPTIPSNEIMCYVFNQNKMIYYTKKNECVIDMIQNDDKIILVIKNTSTTNTNYVYIYVNMDDNIIKYLPENIEYVSHNGNRLYFIEHKSNEKKLIEM